MGIRLTHNRAELIQDPTDTSTKKLIRKRDYQGTASQSFSDVVESPFGRNSTAYQSGGGFNNKGGYVHHFANDVTLQKANQTYQDLITDGLFDQNFLSLALEVVFYNENYQAGTVLIYQFLENNAGRVESYKDRRAFFESRYNANYHQQSKSMVSFLIFLDAVYWLGLFWITFDAVKKVYNIVVTLIRFRVFAIDAMESVDILVVILKMICAGYRIASFVFGEEIVCKAETIELKELEEYIQISTTTREFTIFASITTILISIRCLRILMTQLPSFGALFDTISIANKDILNFCSSMAVIAVGFAFAASLLFGQEISDFDDFSKAFLKMFYYNFSDGRVDEYKTTEHYLFAVFYIIFLMIFFFILNKTFISIVIIRYRYLRSIKQLDNEAKAKVVSKKFQRIKNILIDSLLGRRTAGQTGNNQAEFGNMDTYWVNVRLNLNELWQIRKPQSADERKKEINDMKDIIFEEKEKRKRERIEKYSEKNINIHKRSLKEMIIYLIYLLLFVIMVAAQLDIKPTFNQKTLGLYIEEKTFKLSMDFTKATSSQSDANLLQVGFLDVFDASFMNFWLEEVLIPQVYVKDYTLLRQNYFIGDPLMRLLIRKKKLLKNERSSSKDIFPQYMVGKSFKIKDDLSQYAETMPIFTKSGQKVEYQKYGSETTPNNVDGYLFLYPKDLKVVTTANHLDDPAVMSINWIHFVLQFVHYNRNEQSYALHEIIFHKYASGEIEPQYVMYITKSYYPGSGECNNFFKCYFRVFLEVVMLIMTSWYLYRILKSLALIYIDLDGKMLEAQNDNMKNSKMYLRYLGISKFVLEGMQLFPAVMFILYRIFVTIFRCLFRFFFCVYIHARRSLFAIIDMTSMVLTLV